MTKAEQYSKKDIIQMFYDHVSSSKVDFWKSVNIDFVIGKREGIYMWDMDEKKKLINCHCNGGVYNLGHRNPRIIKAMNEGMKEFDIGNGHLISRQRAILGKKLAELAPGDITRAVFGSGGGEAIDLAIKLARGYTKKHKIISAHGGYHGHTGFALAAGDEKYRSQFGPMSPGFIQVPFNDAIEVEKKIDSETSAVILETIPATLGMPVPDHDYFTQIRELCDRKGILMIIDEVQTGLGRTGKVWAIEHFNTVPDIIVTAKGFSGGMFPIAATLFREKLEDFFRESDPFIHVSTYGGAEVGCSVALEGLNIITEPGFLDNVNKIAKIFNAEFIKLKEKYPEVLVQLRQLGLMMGIEMVDESAGLVMVLSCYNNGIFLVYSNNERKVCQFLPPLIINEAEARDTVSRLDKALAETRDKLNL